MRTRTRWSVQDANPGPTRVHRSRHPEVFKEVQETGVRLGVPPPVSRWDPGPTGPGTRAALGVSGGIRSTGRLESGVGGRQGTTGDETRGPVPRKGSSRPTVAPVGHPVHSRREDVIPRRRTSPVPSPVCSPTPPQTPTGGRQTCDSDSRERGGTPRDSTESQVTGRNLDVSAHTQEVGDGSGVGSPGRRRRVGSPVRPRGVTDLGVRPEPGGGVGSLNHCHCPTSQLIGPADTPSRPQDSPCSGRDTT